MDTPLPAPAKSNTLPAPHVKKASTAAAPAFHHECSEKNHIVGIRADKNLGNIVPPARHNVETCQNFVHEVEGKRILTENTS